MNNPMPKDNEVDEKVVARFRATGDYAYPVDVAEDGEYVLHDDYAATVAELRAKADAAERRAGELEALLAAIRLYAQHDDACGDMDAYNNATIESCGCGLDSLLDASSEALTGADPT